MRKIKDKNWDFEPATSSANKILDSFEKYIVNYYGKRCKTKACGCPVCQAWAIYDLLKVFLH